MFLKAGIQITEQITASYVIKAPAWGKMAIWSIVHNLTKVQFVFFGASLHSCSLESFT